MGSCQEDPRTGWRHRTRGGAPEDNVLKEFVVFRQRQDAEKSGYGVHVGISPEKLEVDVIEDGSC